MKMPSIKLPPRILNKLIFTHAVLCGFWVGTTYAVPAYENIGSGTWVVSGEYNPDGAESYERYKQNYVYGMTESVKQSNPLDEGRFPASNAVDGRTIMEVGSDVDGITHTNGPHWWQIKLTKNDLSGISFSDLTSLSLYQRNGNKDRLVNYTISVYTIDPEEEGATPLWTSPAQPNFQFIQGTAIDQSQMTIPTDAENIWIRVTNGSGQALSLTEAQVFTNTTYERSELSNVTTFGASPCSLISTDGKLYIPNNFEIKDGATLTMDISGTTSDSISVAGALFLDGTLNINVGDMSDVVAGKSWNFFNSYRTYGNFDKIQVSNPQALDEKGLILNVEAYQQNVMGNLTTFSATVLKQSASENAAWNDASNWGGVTTGQEVNIGVYALHEEVKASSATISTPDSISTLVLGRFTGSSGALTVVDGAELSVTGGDVHLGVSGKGAYTQTGGVFTAKNDFYASRVADSASVDISGGNFTVEKSTYLANGTGTTVTMNVSESDATGNPTNISMARLLVASGVNSNATMNISGGTLNIGETYIGTNGGATGKVELSGGTYNSTGTFVVGNGGNATLDISGSGTLKSTGNFILSSNSSGTINQSGGTANFDGGIQFGNNQGAYNLSNGTMTATSITKTDSQNTLTPTFNISGGQATVMGDISVPVVMDGGKLTAGSISSTTTIQSGELSLGRATTSLQISGGTLTAGADNGDGTRTLTVAAGQKLSLVKYDGLSPENLALGKTATQWTSANNFPAARANDGEKGDSEYYPWGGYNFMHTASDGGGINLWAVDFGSVQDIYATQIYHRTGYEARLIGGNGYRFEIYNGSINNILNSDGSVNTYDISWMTPENLVFTSDNYTSYTRGDVVYLLKDGEKVTTQGQILCLIRNDSPGYPQALNLQEVEVYSHLLTIPTLQMNVFTTENMKLQPDGTVTVVDEGATQLWKSDQLVFEEGAMLELDGTILDIRIDQPAENLPLDFYTWQLFDSLDLESTFNGTQFGEIKLPELSGWSWDTSRLYTFGELRLNPSSDSVPEPATWLLLALSVGGLYVLRKRH